MVKVFIFDMDGVLVDSEGFYFERRMRFFQDNGLEPGSTDINDYLGVSNQKVWELLVPDEQVRQLIKREYLEFLKDNEINYVKYLNSNVREVLKFLKTKGIKIILASAGERSEIERMLAECDLKQYFNIVLSGEEVAHNKPAPDIYLEAVRKANVKKSDCIVIEDSPTGILAAKSAGLTTWAIKTNSDQSEADKLVNDLGDIFNKLG